MPDHVKFKMRFEPMTIEHLGLRLYSTLPPVLAELVSNAYDAEAPKVEVVLPTAAITPVSELVVRDYGLGLSAEEIQEEYLPIGRNRRGIDLTRTKSKNGLRTVLGRKGLGRLSAFGVADEMEVRSVQAGEAWTLRLNFQEMRQWAIQYPQREYEPEIVRARSGKTTDPSGVEVRLRRLHRNRAMIHTARRPRSLGDAAAPVQESVASEPGLD